jgi:phage terminase small subunit
LILERRPQETTYNGKKTTHYTLHINTDKSITEMVRQSQIAPERVLIEAYGNEVKTLPAPEEIMDAETTQETYKPTSSQPEDVIPDIDKIKTEVQDAPADSPDKLAEYDKTSQKILDTFSGEKVDATPEKTTESKEFLDGLKKDAKTELGSDGNQDPKIVFPKLFPKFMAFCKQQLEKVGKGDMYKDAFHLYSVKTAADLEKDIKKQADMRKYLEGLVEDEVKSCE